MTRLTTTEVAIGLVVGLLTCGTAVGQEREKTLQLRRLDAPPRIDGHVDDACWQSSEPATGFVQYDPANGTPASEQTLVWAGYDKEHVYFAFLLKDSRPDRIWAELTPRGEFELNDSITAILDTYNDRRTSIRFTVNPKGVQKNSVETIWRSEAAMREDGWSAEFAIPFKSLRFSSADEQVWGINFERYVHRLNERDYWTTVRRDKPLLLQMGEMRGLSGVRPGHNFELFPYLGVRTSRWAGEKDDKLAGGLDVKYGISSNLVLDVTASPDFSEVESDPFIYQLSPFENYFRERRPFFTEGSQYFTTAVEHGGFFRGPGLSLFYSRRISDPRFAAKLTGKTAGYSFGLLGALTEDPESGDTAPFTALRLQRDVLGDSQIGAYFLSLDREDARNRNLAVDYGFRFRDIYSVQGLSAVTYNSDRPAGRNGVHMLRFERAPDAGWKVEGSFDRIEENVAVGTGYVSATDIQTTRAELGHAWRFNGGRLKRFSLGTSGTLRQEASGETAGHFVSLDSALQLHPEMELALFAGAGERRYQVLGEDGSLAWTDDVIGTRDLWAGFFWMRGGFLKQVHLSASWEKTGVYSDDFSRVGPGSQRRLEASMALRPRSNFQLSLGTEWISQALDQTGQEVFSGLTYQAGLHYQVSRGLFLSTRFMGETREDQYNLDLVAGYHLGAGNVLQVAYKKSSRMEELTRESGHSITFKLSYLLRL